MLTLERFRIALALCLPVLISLGPACASEISAAQGLTFAVTTVDRSTFHLVARPASTAPPPASPFVVQTGNWPGATMQQSASGALVQTPDGTLRVGRGGALSLSGSGTALVPSGSISVANGVITLRLPHNPAERFYGAGNESENHAGSLMHPSGNQIISNGVTRIPFLWSTGGWSVFVANNQMGGAWHDENGVLTWTLPGPTLDLYLSVAPSGYGLLDAFSRLTGRAPIPPRWTFGFMLSRWGYTDGADVQDKWQQFRDRKIPVDSFEYDYDWFDNDWIINRKLFPEGSFAKMKRMGLHFVGIRKPRINGSALDYARSQGWVLSSPYGTDLRFDLPAARTWWWSHQVPLVQEAVDGWWNDEAEQTYDEFFQMSQTEWDGWRAMSPRRAWSINRAFAPGIQRFGAATWTGDIDSSWGTLSNQPGTMLNWSLAGMPYVGQDIGGFQGTPTPDMYARWMEEGAFVPVMRAHGTYNSPRWPWAFGDDVLSASKRAIELRYRLIPYFYTFAAQTAATGAPLMRPLLLEFPLDPKVADLGNEWLMGDRLLAAPILTPGGRRDIYLPKGNWFDFNSNQSITGGQTLRVQAPLDMIPAYVRAGSIIPLGPVIQSTALGAEDPLEVRVYPGANAAFTLYEDEGDTYGYLQGKSSQIPMHWDDRTRAFTVDARTGSFPGMLKTRHLTAVLPDGTKRSLTYTGQALSAVLPKPLSAAPVAVPLIVTADPSALAVKPFVASVFTDNMVLQRGLSDPVWGWTTPGTTVTATIDGKTASGIAGADGRYTVKLAPLAAGGPYTLTVSGPKKIIFSNVLVGEVWVCSGQSNMEFGIGHANNAASEIASADYPQIHLFSVDKTAALEPRTAIRGSWLPCSPDTIKRGTDDGFSAVAYFFGRDLYKKLHVPIGLIQTAWGGTPAEAWTSQTALLRAMPSLAVPPTQLSFDQNTPTATYNGMAAPLIPYGIKGVLWYQGEANDGRSRQYRTLLPALVRDWRSQWGEGDFPFEIVQLAGLETGGSGSWADIREAQADTAKLLPNVGLVTAIDIGERHDIHPKNKQEVGRRLALVAEANAYGETTEYSGPVYSRSQIEGTKIRVSFTQLGGGLTAKDPAALTGFVIAGNDLKFVPAEARIDGGTVVVSSPQIASPAAVRYAWSDWADCSLYGRSGLPAFPFRTDPYVGPEKLQLPGNAPNLAALAAATASSVQGGTSSFPSAAVDGIVDGYPSVPESEWASSNEGAGAWLRLDWKSPQSVDHLRLYDRPNGDDQVTSGTITFSDGSSVPVGPLANDGKTPTEISFPAKRTTWLKFTVTGVSNSTRNVGISEIAAYRSGTNASPKIGFIGDSITSGYNQLGSTITPGISDTAALTIQKMSQIPAWRLTNDGVPWSVYDQGSSGSSTESWLPGTPDSLEGRAKSAFIGAFGQPDPKTNPVWVLLMLGTNDVRSDNLYVPERHRRNLQAIIDDLVSSGFNVLLNHAPAFVAPTSFNGVTWDAKSLALLRSYLPEEQAVVDSFKSRTPGRVTLGDTAAFDYFAAHPALFQEYGVYGGMHPNGTGGTDALAGFWANAFSIKRNKGTLALPVSP